MLKAEQTKALGSYMSKCYQNQMKGLSALFSINKITNETRAKFFGPGLIIHVSLCIIIPQRLPTSAQEMFDIH